MGCQEEAPLDKRISVKQVKRVAILATLGMTAMVLGLFFRPLLAVAVVLLGASLLLRRKVFRCPFCGTPENPRKLLMALQTPHYCKKCGKRIQFIEDD